MIKFIKYLLETIATDCKLYKILSADEYKSRRHEGEFPNKKWAELAKGLMIPGDEQVVCALGIGNLKARYKVPVSYRFPETTIATHL